MEIQQKVIDDPQKGAWSDKLNLIRKSGLSPQQLKWMYQNMITSRMVDDTEIKMNKHSQAFFQISTAGHEGVQTAAALVFRPSYDHFLCYYRNKAICLGLGVTPYEMFCQANGNMGDTASKGRQMPANMGNRKLHIVSRSSCTGTQFLQAAGMAQAGKILTLLGEDSAFHDEVIYVSCGDGTVAQGEFWESLTTCVINELPVLFMVEDNKRAISVPTHVGTPLGSISKTLEHFPGLTVIECDGHCPIESYISLCKARDLIRKNRRPVLFHAHVTRLYSHSLSDDHRHYQSPEELEKLTDYDVLVNFQKLLIAANLVTQEELFNIERRVKSDIKLALEKALTTPWPSKSSCCDYLWSDEIDPQNERSFQTNPHPVGEELSMAQAINWTLKSEILSNPKMVIFGEDVADTSEVELLDKVVGKGGVFKVTQGIQKVARDYQVFNSPLAEANIVGRAIGMALRGLRPVVEIQFFDYIWTAFMQLKNEMATTRYRSGGEYKNPMVVRAAIGGYVRGGGLYHSQCAESIFTHIPGIYVVFPSNAFDAQGLLRTAIRCDDPVMFLEHKHLYYQGYNKASYQGDDFMIPFGKANIIEQGHDATIICWGALVHKSLLAAKKFPHHSIEIIDLRTLIPLDKITLIESLKKTNKVLIAQEAGLTSSFAQEIASMLGQSCFKHLDAPIMTLGAKDCHIPYNPDLQEAILPQVDDIVEMLEKLLQY